VFCTNWEIIILACTLAVTIATPLVTALVQVSASKKERTFKFRNEHKAETIEGYLRSTSFICKSKNIDSRAEYGKYYSLIYQYVDDDLAHRILDVDHLIGKHDYDTASDKLVEISCLLKEINPRLHR